MKTFLWHLIFLDPKANITNLSRCCHLIIEEASDCLEKFSSEIESIMKNLLLSRKPEIEQPYQIVVSSSEWNVALEQYVELFMKRKNMVGPFIVLANCLEALIYSKLEFQTHFMESTTSKLEALFEMFVGRSGKRDFIICWKIQGVPIENCQK